MTEAMSSWADGLHELLNSKDTEDSNVINFIEENLPKDEGRIFDYKREMYISADCGETDNKRKGKLIKLLNALSNVKDESPYRYIFIGFSDGRFEGIKYRGSKGGSHIAEADEAKIQNLIHDYLEPIPEVKRNKLSGNNREGCILEIERATSRPVLIDQSVRIADGRETIIYEGQAYTRKGSRNTLMTNADFRDIIERRKEVMGKMLEEFADDLNRVIDLPTEQLEQLDLSVSSANEGVPVKEIVTTNPAEDVNEKLKTAVKIGIVLGDGIMVVN